MNKQKQQAIGVKLENMVDYILKNNIQDIPKYKKVIQKAVEYIIGIVDSKTSRSLPENGMYWKWLQWAAPHTPEMMLKLLDITAMTDKLLHELIKSKFNITSTAFDKLDEQTFNEFFNNSQTWIAMYFMKCSKEEMFKIFQDTVN